MLHKNYFKFKLNYRLASKSKAPSVGRWIHDRLKYCVLLINGQLCSSGVLEHQCPCVLKLFLVCKIQLNLDNAILIDLKLLVHYLILTYAVLALSLLSQVYEYEPESSI